MEISKLGYYKIQFTMANIIKQFYAYCKKIAIDESGSTMITYINPSNPAIESFIVFNNRVELLIEPVPATSIGNRTMTAIKTRGIAWVSIATAGDGSKHVVAEHQFTSPVKNSVAPLIEDRPLPAPLTDKEIANTLMDVMARAQEAMRKL